METQRTSEQIVPTEVERSKLILDVTEETEVEEEVDKLPGQTAERDPGHTAETDQGGNPSGNIEEHTLQRKKAIIRNLSPAVQNQKLMVMVKPRRKRAS